MHRRSLFFLVSGFFFVRFFSQKNQGFLVFPLIFSENPMILKATSPIVSNDGVRGDSEKDRFRLFYRGLFFLQSISSKIRLNTIVYIDGFNLYYSLKNTPYKWLNLQTLIENILDPSLHKIQDIKYFTATRFAPTLDLRFEE